MRKWQFPLSLFCVALVFASVPCYGADRHVLQFGCWLDRPGKDDNADLLCKGIHLMLLVNLNARDLRAGEQTPHPKIELALTPIYVEALRTKDSDPDGYAIHERVTIVDRKPIDEGLVCGANDDVHCAQRIESSFLYFLQHR